MKACNRCTGYLLQHPQLIEYKKCPACGYSRRIAKMINWNDPKSMISLHFSVKEALWLPHWNRMTTEEDGLTSDIKENLITLCQKLDQVRDYFQLPINIHVMFRPIEYNKEIGGAKNSSHCLGKAADFDIQGMNCDDVRERIVLNNKLEEWVMRLEDKPGSDWCHLDFSDVINSRFFKP